MLNPFPSLLALSFFAPTLLRIVAGAFLFVLGSSRLGKKKESMQNELRPKYKSFSKAMVLVAGVTEIAVGTLLIVGAWTQVAALVLIVIAIKYLFLNKKYPVFVPLARSTSLLLLVIAITLLITGAGAFAYDLPL